MVLRNSLLIFICLYSPIWLSGQYSNIVHYTVKDGLPSSTTFSMTQDNQGFIWIGTEAGLVRFDGTKFKVYNTQDGLPDNEVLGVLFDNKTNRLWILPYSKSICYYKDRKIYTAKNDSSLRSIVCDFGEYIRGNEQDGLGVFLYNGHNLYCVTGNSIKTIKTTRADVKDVHQWSNSDLDVVCNSGLFSIKSGKEMEYIGGGLDSPCLNAKWIGQNFFVLRSGYVDVYNRDKDGHYSSRGRVDFGVRRSVTNAILKNNVYFMSVEGTGLYTVDTSLHGDIKKIWSGRLNAIADDRDGNIWISTNDDGIYLLKNQIVRSYSSENDLKHDNITSLYAEKDGTILFGNSYGEVFSLRDNLISPLHIEHTANIEMIRGIVTYKNRIFLLANNMVGYIEKGQRRFNEIPHIQGGPKSILLLKGNEDLLFGFSSGVMDFKTKDASFNEMGFNKRVITLAQHPDGRIFCGSLDGLYQWKNQMMAHVTGDDPRLQSRITCLCYSPDSILWIGTPSNGIMAYDGTRIIGQITTSNNLSYRGALCRKVVSSGRNNEIWVATNAGIDKIRYHIHDTLIVDNITPINSIDGLESDDVNDVLIRDSLIYVATSHGLTVLNEKELSMPHSSPTYISTVRINDVDSPVHEGVYELSYRQNNLEIEYIGVSLHSSGYIRYQYRLLGSSDEWQTTDQTSIDLRSISPGLYTFEVAILDKFGNRSLQTASVKFHITPAFYRTFWFLGLVLLVILSIGFYIIRSTFLRRQAQYEKEQSYNNKIIDLEQQALKAQMNPHFIFNCLTAIQHFVNKEDVYSANMYLSNFAKLIRKTLDLSGEQHISLDKEVAYLENYIQLEKMRFQEQFNYTIEVDKNVDIFGSMVPPMLLQPIIENAIRHGLRYKDNNEGLLKISFSKSANKLICKIDDNGIGIKRSKELKTSSHVEYQSKGMKLTESRINAINMISQKKISMEVKDKYDDRGQAIGTLVIINFEQ